MYRLFTKTGQELALNDTITLSTVKRLLAIGCLGLLQSVIKVFHIKEKINLRQR
jgi:hypothetical protein